MLKLVPSALEDALRDVGLEAGDSVMIHAAIQFLGRPEGGVSMYAEVLRRVLGPEATLVVPTFNFGFAKGQPFERAETPSDGMGALAEFLRCLPTARRSWHPLQSVAAVGPLADELTCQDTPSAFDPGSPFERLVKHDFKLLLLGADIEYVSLVHYCEQRCEVPYRYWKDFTGRAHGLERTYRMYVRDLETNPQVEQARIQAELERQALFRQVSLGYGKVASFRARDFVRVTEDILARDPWGLISNRP